MDDEVATGAIHVHNPRGHQTLLRECTLERMDAAGSGGIAELLAWFVALAFTQVPAEVLACMPAIAWRSGTGMAAWNEVADGAR